MSSGTNNQPPRISIAHVALVAVVLLLAGTAVSLLPVHQSETQQFASPAFQRVWVNEAAASTRAIDLWGGEPLASRVEPYLGAPNDRRVVQYFDRGRMEVETGANEVTQGKLALELTTGEIDLGGNLTLERQSPEIPIDSGEPHERVPTWLTLSRVVGNSAGDRSNSGERIIRALSRDGTYEAGSTPELRRYAAYVEETGHNLPDVTVELFQRPEFENDRWLDSFGYPISEPYWTEYRRQEERHPALVQVFERRVLVYTPGVEEMRSFTTPSMGRHYAIWRYGAEPHADQEENDEQLTPAGVTPGEDLDASIYVENIGTPVDLTLSATGHLMILNAEGEILKAESRDPDGYPDEFILWAEGIEDPQGITSRGNTVVVTAGHQVLFLHDENGRGVAGVADDSIDDGTSSVDQRTTGKPVRNTAGDIFAPIDTSTGQELREIGSDDVLVDLSHVVESPGPVAFVSGDLIVTGRNGDQPEIHLIPSIFRSNNEPQPEKIAAFSSDTEIRAVAVANEDIWSISEFGDVLIAVQDDEGTRLMAMSRNHRGSNGQELEMVELANGLNRPTAIQVGLDGSIYVAEADPGRIIKIQHKP